MFLSVIIPAYNASSTITRALDSVKNQTYACEYEIIIINDGSTDNTLQVINDYRNQNEQINIIIIDKENGGVSSARNAGLLKAKGRYIALLDADDEWVDVKLAKQFAILQENPKVDFLGTNILGRQPIVGFQKIKKPSKINIKNILIKMNPQTSTVIFKREILDTVGLYDETLSHGEDGDLWLRIMSKFECWFLPDALVIFDGGKRGFGGSGLSGNLQKMQQGMRRLIREAYKSKKINSLEFYSIAIYNEFKYIIRQIINRF